MVQNWQLPVGGFVGGSASRTLWNDALLNLQSNSAGTTQPSGGVQPLSGQLWINTAGTTASLNIVGIGKIVDVVSGSDHLLRTGEFPMQGNIDLHSAAGTTHQIKNLADPVDLQDAVNVRSLNRINVEKGSYVGNGAGEREIFLSNSDLDIGWLEVFDRADTSSVANRFKTTNMDSEMSRGGDGDAHVQGEMITSISKGKFTISSGLFLNISGRSYGYIAFGKLI